MWSEDHKQQSCRDHILWECGGAGSQTWSLKPVWQSRSPLDSLDLGQFLSRDIGMRKGGRFFGVGGALIPRKDRSVMFPLPRLDLGRSGAPIFGHMTGDPHVQPSSNAAKVARHPGL